MLTGCLVCLFCISYAIAHSKPNILLIVADDLGWNDVSFHGSNQIPTPNIDALASDGIILNKYYVSPLCTPSRGSLFTGKYAVKLGLQHYVIGASEPWGLPLNEKVLPQYLKDLGYITHGIGKWHLGHFTQDYLPTRRGFDSFFGYWTGEKDYFNHFALEKDMCGLDLHDGESSVWSNNGFYSTELFTDRAKKIIATHNSTKPLFLYLGYQAVHSGNSYSPLQAPLHYVQNFTPINDLDRRKFAGMVSALDMGIGEVLESLKEAKKLDNVLIVFTTDNGGAVQGVDGSTGSNWPLRGSKYTLWEGGVRGVSFIWSSKLRRKSRVEESLFHISDWLPTLYAAAGGRSNKLPDLDGIDQWRMLSEMLPSKRMKILHNIDDTWNVASVRNGSYKLVKGSMREYLDGWFDKQGKPQKYLQSNKGLQKYSRSKEIYEKAKVVRTLEEWFGKSFNKKHVLRQNLIIDCGLKPKNFTKNCQPMRSSCLFDVEKDPCEYNNIADVHPEIVSQLQSLLQEYEKKAVPPGNKPSDPTANPKHHGYAWVPWILS